MNLIQRILIRYLFFHKEPVIDTVPHHQKKTLGPNPTHHLRKNITRSDFLEFVSNKAMSQSYWSVCPGGGSPKAKVFFWWHKNSLTLQYYLPFSLKSLRLLLNQRFPKIGSPLIRYPGCAKYAPPPQPHPSQAGIFAVIFGLLGVRVTPDHFIILSRTILI